MPDDEHVISTTNAQPMITLQLHSHASPSRLQESPHYSPPRISRGSPTRLSFDQGAVARRLIDKIFDLELKKESLLKAVTRYSVNVDSDLLDLVNTRLTSTLARFLELSTPLGLTLTDIVKASMSIHLSEADQDSTLLNLKIRFLFLIVCQFREMR